MNKFFKLEIENSKAFIVIGETGEYDEYVNWDVAVFANINVANQYKERLDKFLVDHAIPNDRGERCPSYDLREPNNPDDPSLADNWHGCGVVYKINEIKVVLKI